MTRLRYIMSNGSEINIPEIKGKDKEILHVHEILFLKRLEIFTE